MNNAQKIVEEIDLVTEGFKKVPVVPLPPKIQWGEEFQKWDDQKKLQFLTKFGEAMNHAADTMQQERNKLGQLVELKEQQILQLKAALDANNQMLQTEITKMNEYRNEATKNIAKLNAKIRELEAG